jgi:uncharacterized protein (DUF1810 family)
MVDLERFVAAQAPLIDDVMAELQAGRKRTHWMWFVFPQLRALGRSSTAHFYGIASLAEARAYLAHPVLGPRLLDCTRAVLAVQGRTLHEIFGTPDDMKFRSCMTLFSQVTPEPFTAALARYCGGEADERTLALLA